MGQGVGGGRRKPAPETLAAHREDRLMSILNWSRAGEAITLGQEPEIGEGVRGTAFDTENGIYIPLIIAERPGTGAVSRFLGALPTDRRVVFPTVTSQRLHAMLARRGFQQIEEAGSEAMERKPTGGTD
jgi:hypothetical protein